jgi:uncharacterized coiled-coil protein SlyX
MTSADLFAALGTRRFTHKRESTMQTPAEQAAPPAMAQNSPQQQQIEQLSAQLSSVVQRVADLEAWRIAVESMRETIPEQEF